MGAAAWVVIAAGVAAPGAAIAQSAPLPAAQEEPAGGEQDSVEIIVTAQGREQSLQDVPITVSVASGELLRDTQVTNLNDLGNRLGGVKINNAGASDSLNIRGIGSGFNMGFEQSVATFVDGVYLSRSQVSRGGFLDIERIEVLKGPQSTYFGSNAIAGALSITTRKPSQNMEGYASALYGSHGEFDVQGAVGGPLGGGFSGRIAARYSGMDGYTRNLRLNNKGPKNDDIQGRVALRYQSPGLVDINLRVDYAKYDDQHSELQELVNCPPLPGYGATSAVCAALVAEGENGKIDYVTRSGDSFFRLETVNGSLGMAWTIGSHTLTSTTGYYEHDLLRSTAGGPILAVPSLNMPGGLPIIQPEKFNSFSQELRLESDKGKLIDYTLGLYFDRSNLDGGLSSGFYFSPFWTRVPPVGIIPANTPVAQLVTASQDQANRSAFAAVTVNVSDAFRVNLGARYSSVLKKAHRATRVGVGNALGEVVTEFTPAQTVAWTSSVGRPAGDYKLTRRVDDKFMPSINVQYDVTPDVMAYISYSTGFKAGGWSIGVAFDTFAPEDVKAFEAGIKANWLDRALL
jgi:outer membrane receptor protein involved in Fe transport